MSQSNDQPPNPSAGDSGEASGRYRFQAGQPVDPDQGVHPELLNSAFADSPSIAIPQSPDRLIAMQENRPEKDRPKKPERSAPEKVKQVLELINSLDTNA